MDPKRVRERQKMYISFFFKSWILYKKKLYLASFVVRNTLIVYWALGFASDAEFRNSFGRLCFSNAFKVA